MLKQRIITALCLIPLVLAGIFLLPASIFSWVLIAIFAIAASEWGRIVARDCKVTQYSFTISFTLLTIALNIMVPADYIWYSSQLHPLYWLIIAIGCCWWLVALFLVAAFPKSKPLVNNVILKTIYGHLTLLPCFASLLALKALGTMNAPYLGPFLVLFVMLVVWAADSGAYFVGKSLGKTKLLPKVSPAKTIEGLLGGLFTSMFIVALIMALSPEQELSLIIGVTVFVALVSALGDLTESMFKRVAKIKDSGNILPGHGGVLDRIDSLTAAFPIFTMIYLAFWM